MLFFILHRTHNQGLMVCMVSCLGLQGVYGQHTEYFGVRAGGGISYQVYKNVPGYLVTPRADTISTGSGGGYNRAGVQLSLFYESMLTPRTGLLLGLGYRQKGFLSDNALNRVSGLVAPLPEGKVINNRLDYLSVDAAVRFRFRSSGRVIPFGALGNRLDWLMGLNTPFWGTKSGKYGNYTQFEYSPFFAAGAEIPLQGLVVRKKMSDRGTLEYSRLVFEIEYNPGIMNVHSTRRGYTRAQLTNATAGQAPLEFRRFVYNRAVNFTIGIRI
jgi:hypothetical protein